MILDKIIKNKIVRRCLGKPLLIVFAAVLLLSATIEVCNMHKHNAIGWNDQKAVAAMHNLEAIEALSKIPLNTTELTHKFYSEAYLFQNTILAQKINQYCAVNTASNTIALSNCNIAAKINNPLYFTYFAFSDDGVKISMLCCLGILLIIIISIKLLRKCWSFLEFYHRI